MQGITETPDCWKFVKITPHDTTKEPHDRVLCSWYGGYLGSNCWKLSSGNQEVIDRGDYLEVPQHSGTVYHLYKASERMSGMMMDIYSQINKNSVDYKLETFDYEPT
jgi:hypothetical protein